MKRNLEMMKCSNGLLLVAIVLLTLLFSLPGVALAASVALEWDPSTDPDLVGYKVYYQANTSARPFLGTGASEGSAPIDVANVLSAAVEGLDPGTTYYFAVTAYNAVGLESVYSNVLEVPESIPPTVAFSSPSGGAAVSGVVTVSATASDNQGVTSVEFYLNGALQATDSAAPYAFSWDASSLGSGLYTLTAKAFDAAGNVGQSEIVVPVAGDFEAPTVNLTEPASNASVSGSVAVTASASDNVGVTKIEIYDNGVLAFATNMNPAGYTWNSEQQANGSHTLSAKAYDAAGNVGTSASVAVTVLNDFSAPSVALSSPANGSTIGGLVNVSANASDDIGVTRVEFYGNGTLLASATGNPFSFNWDTSTVANGQYTLMAMAYDASGKVGESTGVAVQVFNDTTAPAISIGFPVAGSTVGGSVTVSANAGDNVAVTKVEFFLNGVLKATATSAPYSFNWDTLSSADGAYTLSTKAYDAAGNVGQAANVAVNVFNDTTAPAVSIASPAVGSTVGGSVAVSASASDDVAVTKVEFFLNGALKATSTSAPYSFNWDTLSFANGAYTLSAKAYDAAGNVGQSANLTVNVFNDITAPTVSIASPAVGNTVGGSVAVSASASDDVAVTKVEFFLNGALKATATSAPYSFNWVTLFSVNGAYTLSAKAYDAAGNVGQSANLTVNVFNDITAPAVSIASPVAGSTLGGSVTVSANATDNVAVTKVEFFLNGVLKATATSAPYSFNWDTLSSINGAYTLSAKAYDAAGNVGQAANLAVSVLNDTTVPVVSIFSPVNTSTVAGSVSVLASASDNVAVIKVEFYVNGALKATSTSAPYGFTWNTGALANGAYTLSAKAYDVAGNIGNSAGISVNVLYDRSAPTITAFSMPSTKNSTTVPVLSLLATDDVAVSGYLITESASVPSASAAGWSANAPTSFTFARTGKRTAYAWAKDAAGNVSAGTPVSVLIDTTLPTISSMTLKSGSSSVTVNASATDNVAVTRMELYLNGVLQLQTSASSFSFICQLTDRRGQTLTVKVYDAAGNVRTRSLKVSKY